MRVELTVFDNRFEWLKEENQRVSCLGMSSWMNNSAIYCDTKAGRRRLGPGCDRIETRNLETLCLNVPLDIQIKKAGRASKHEFQAQGRVMTREIKVFVISVSVSCGTCGS